MVGGRERSGNPAGVPRSPASKSYCVIPARGAARARRRAGKANCARPPDMYLRTTPLARGAAAAGRHAHATPRGGPRRHTHAGEQVRSAIHCPKRLHCDMLPPLGAISPAVQTCRVPALRRSRRTGNGKGPSGEDGEERGGRAGVGEPGRKKKNSGWRGSGRGRRGRERKGGPSWRPRRRGGRRRREDRQARLPPGQSRRPQLQARQASRRAGQKAVAAILTEGCTTRSRSCFSSHPPRISRGSLLPRCH